MDVGRCVGEPGEECRLDGGALERGRSSIRSLVGERRAVRLVSDVVREEAGGRGCVEEDEDEAIGWREDEELGPPLRG